MRAQGRILCDSVEVSLVDVWTQSIQDAAESIASAERPPAAEEIKEWKPGKKLDRSTKRQKREPASGRLVGADSVLKVRPRVPQGNASDPVRAAWGSVAEIPVKGTNAFCADTYAVWIEGATDVVGRRTE